MTGSNLAGLTMDQLLMLGIIPAALAVAASLIVQRVSGRRFLLILLGVSAALLLSISIAGAQDSQSGFRAATLLAPVTLGVLTLALVHIRDFGELRRGEKALALGLGLANMALLAGAWNQPSGWALVLLPAAALLTILWSSGRASRPVTVGLSLVALALLALLNSDLLPRLPGWLGFLGLGFLATILPVTAAALLVSTGVRRLAGPSTPEAGPRWPALWHLALAAVVIGYLADTVFWASIWDQTSDGVGGSFLAMTAGLAAITAGALIGATSSGWHRLTGLAFAIVVPLVIFQALDADLWGVYHTITDERAARLQTALERFRARSGRYPDELSELVPGDLWWIPGPVILRGEGWCYQGGQDFYRLGAVYREYFSTPLSVRVYASAGDLPEADWECEARLAELAPRYNPPPMVGLPESAPTPAPLPTSVVAAPRTPVQPMVRAASIELGGWSLDGNYLAFGVLEVSGDQIMLDLNFLDARTGGVCPASETRWAMDQIADGLDEHVAWLPDGRLLFISAAGEMLLFKPCSPGQEDLTGRYPAAFTRAAAHDDRSGRVLLKNPGSYWLLDTASLAARPVVGISPNPYELHWDRYGWSPGGDALAISRLNGREARDGSTLYIVDGATGELRRSLPLEYATDQSAPSVTWLTDNELLLHGGGALAVVDVHAEPPRITDVVRDLLLLDIAYPDDFSAMAPVTDPTGDGYHLAVRVRHPRTQAIYLYHSKTDQVEVLQSTAEVLLVFPGGATVGPLPSESPPTDRDEYELIWVDAPGSERQRLVVTGHLPRHSPSLFARALPNSSRMIFSSSQGLSLVSLPDGELQAFWKLEGGGAGPSPYVLASPDGEALVALVERVGLYFIRVPAE